MDPNHFWNLLAKKLSGEATAAEESELEALLQSHPELAFSTQRLSDLWAHKKPETNGTTEEAFVQHWQKLQSLQPSPPAHSQQRKPRIKKWQVLTACLVLLFTGWLLLQNSGVQPAKATPQPAEISTRQGARTRLLLPDGSEVWLNAGSKLRYEPGFGTSNRNAVLVGEAFFDVKKSTLPFMIKANGVHIKVLGTAFNVKAYPNEPTTETSLLRGRVEITLDKRPGELIVLKPNEKLVVANNASEENSSHTKQPIVVLKELTRVNDSLVPETSWVENKLIFQDESLLDVARKMERWYNVTIDIKDENLAQLRVGGGPFENETIEQALTALQIAFNFTFSEKGNHITITR